MPATAHAATGPSDETPLTDHWKISPARGPSAPAPERPRVRRNWAAELLETEGDARSLARRAGIGAILAAAYGIAIGTREGGLAPLVHAAGVPAALAAVTLLGLPALDIALALFDAPLSPRRAAGSAVQGVASAGLVLAGIAPLAALYVVTSASTGAASTSHSAVSSGSAT